MTICRLIAQQYGFRYTIIKTFYKGCKCRLSLNISHTHTEINDSHLVWHIFSPLTIWEAMGKITECKYDVLLGNYLPEIVRKCAFKIMSSLGLCDFSYERENPNIYWCTAAYFARSYCRSTKMLAAEVLLYFIDDKETKS